MEQRITKNFSFYEFAPSGAGKDWLPDNQYQQMMITLLARNLQIVREQMPSYSFITITSAVRDAKDYDRLKKGGYNPSETSDHNFGNAVQLKPGTDKYKKFGPTYNFTVGAADCVPTGITAKELFNIAMQLIRNNKCFFGQVIYEHNPVKNVDWVHFGGYYTYFFSDPIVQFLDKPLFRKSTDNGKTYQGIDNFL